MGRGGSRHGVSSEPTGRLSEAELRGLREGSMARRTIDIGNLDWPIMVTTSRRNGAMLRR